MLSKNDDFLIKKIQEINLALESQSSDMYELIGSVKDLFSSAYISKPIASTDVVKNLFNALLNVFISSDVYENQFDSVITMSDINLYAKRINIKLCLCRLKKWRNEHNEINSTEEILECVDDILII
ncbi:hypothetical protein PL246_23330 [Salmonella enterica]|uniref:hypothetical protein n=1 Tax=Salmonella enterica TaxID=28901 RepID=UPI0009B140C1|nr:hypothetical protein [Salmonella enterica]ECG1483829.1 hypothetical protein [Salmonella enterica subsp. enterica]ECF6265279.1 hypothetical protein [Salmonella enterica]ECH2659658.1 hypothetical protein [Salmonella enterica]EDP9633563.1 hypothetical protein [Salmonella enterica subsp. enterica]EGK3402812.1 hypothetical protein [Salmonella enterica]